MLHKVLSNCRHAHDKSKRSINYLFKNEATVCLLAHGICEGSMRAWDAASIKSVHNEEMRHFVEKAQAAQSFYWYFELRQSTASVCKKNSGVVIETDDVYSISIELFRCLSFSCRKAFIKSSWGLFSFLLSFPLKRKYAPRTSWKM